MECYDCIGAVSWNDDNGNVQTKQVGPEQRVFCNSAGEAKDLYREQNGGELAKARKEGTVDVLVRQFKNC